MNKGKKIACGGGLGSKAKNIHFGVSVYTGVGRGSHGLRHHVSAIVLIPARCSGDFWVKDQPKPFEPGSLQERQGTEFPSPVPGNKDVLIQQWRGQ